jgi:hypothetical protein
MNFLDVSEHVLDKLEGEKPLGPFCHYPECPNQAEYRVIVFSKALCEKMVFLTCKDHLPTYKPDMQIFKQKL